MPGGDDGVCGHGRNNKGVKQKDIMQKKRLVVFVALPMPGGKNNGNSAIDQCHVQGLLGEKLTYIAC